jgi:alpha-mannosidase
MQKRIKANNISIEGNYFPITSMAYLEDEKSRISLVVDHAQGAASWQQVRIHFTILALVVA